MNICKTNHHHLQTQAAQWFRSRDRFCNLLTARLAWSTPITSPMGAKPSDQTYFFALRPHAIPEWLDPFSAQDAKYHHERMEKVVEVPSETELSLAVTTAPGYVVLCFASAAPDRSTMGGWHEAICQEVMNDITRMNNVCRYGRTKAGVDAAQNKWIKGTTNTYSCHML